MKLSISTTAFSSKPTKKEISKITFSEQTLSVSELAECIRKGHAFCGIFYHTTDTLGIESKSKDNFKCSWYIGIDCDDMSVPMDEYLTQLPIQPSIAYTTSSNGIDGYRYRLVYALDEPTQHPLEHENKYYALLERLGIDQNSIKDNCGSQCSRMFYGSYNCALRLSPTVIETASLTAIHHYDDESKVKPAKEKSSRPVGRISDLFTGDFKSDWYKLPLIDILTKYDAEYGFWRKEIDKVYNEQGVYEYKPNDGMICIPRFKDDNGMYVNMVKKGWRTNKSFIYATQIRLLNPDITFNGLCYALGELIYKKFVLDAQITNNWIAQQAAAAWAIPFKELKSSVRGKFTTSKEYAESHRMSRREVASSYRRDKKDKQIARYFNALKTDRENVKILKEHEITVSAKFIKAFRERHNLTKSAMQIERFQELVELGMCMNEIMNELGISRATYFRLKKESQK